jgi:hypothetical protein
MGAQPKPGIDGATDTAVDSPPPRPRSPSSVVPPFVPPSETVTSDGLSMNGSLGPSIDRRRSPSPRPRTTVVGSSGQGSAYSRYPPTMAATSASSSSRPGWATPDTQTYPPTFTYGSPVQEHPLPPPPGPGEASHYAYSTTLRRAPTEDGIERLVHTAEAIRDAGPGGVWDRVVHNVKRVVGADDGRADHAENGYGYEMLPKERRDTLASKFSSTSIEVRILSSHTLCAS